MGGVFYDGKADKQMQLIILDITSMIPQNHLFGQIKNGVNFISSTKKLLLIIFE